MRKEAKMIKSFELSIIYFILFGAFAGAQPFSVNFRIEIWKDTIYIGDPIILKCWVINDNSAAVKVWHRGPLGLLANGNVDYYLISHQNDTSYYGINIEDFSRQSPELEIASKDSFYWYSLLSWHNFHFHSNKVSQFSSGFYRIIAKYYLPIECDTGDYSEIVIQSNEVSFYAIEETVFEQEIFNKWISLTKEYFLWGERFETTWTRKDYNELCKWVAETKSRFAMYAHYIYCKSTGDKKAMRKFLDKYPGTPLTELVEFMYNPEEAKRKYPLNFFSK